MLPLRHAEREEILFSGPDAEAAFSRARAMLWAYRFYPPSIAAAATPRIEVGEVIHQRVRLWPLTFPGPVLLTHVWDGPARAGYSYEALPGHVERGRATYEVWRSGEDVRFRIATDSAPQHWLARLGAPVARWLQRRAAAGAFQRMRAQAAGQGGDR